MPRKKKEINLDSIILREVEHRFSVININNFRGKLQQPIFMLTNGQKTLGWWQSSTRTLALSREILKRASNWYKLEAVLKHEMAHQYVDEVLQAKEVDPHGPLFQQVCQENNLDMPSMFEIEEEEKFEKDSVIDKINKLLSLANSPNEHEAENAVKFAEKLMKKWNIKSLQDDTREFAYRYITEPAKKRNIFLTSASAVLSQHFFVKCIWVWQFNPLADKGKGKSGYVLEISGTPENLEIAHYVFDYIKSYAERAFKAHKKEGGHGTLTNYMAGVADGFRYKLTRQKNEEIDAMRESGEYDEAEHVCNDLVWLEDPKLEEYYRKRHPNTTRSYNNYEGSRGGYGAGHSKGKTMNLSMGVGSSGSGVAGLLG